mmetsp:Transcript_11464/g.22514  ORF Transcript_11464/g.22514 Transcript_11464/m.22514 type:complete len:315 (+) Transcript_11464:434-1378(+)
MMELSSEDLRLNTLTLRSTSQKKKWEILLQTSSTPPVFGLRNFGNTCFINATLQCLLRAAPLHNFDHRCANVNCSLCTLKSLASRQCSVQHDQVANLGKLCRNFRVGKQEDAHEFLRQFMELLRPKEFLIGVFGGLLWSRVTCLNCQITSETSEEFYDLALDVTAGSLSECLQEFCKLENLADRYFCTTCEASTPATKQYLVRNPPLILTVTLKRFTPRGRKNSQPVTYPARLNLARFLLEPRRCMYALFAVLVHSGYSCHSGHYYAFVKADDQWYEANDSVVKPVAVEDVLNCKDSYLLFYQADPPKRRSVRG